MTGVTGFVGSHLTEELLRRNWEVVGLIPPEERIDPQIAGFQEIRVIRGSILDPDGLAVHLEESGVTEVIHLAAESAPSKSFSLPQRFFDVNVLGTQYLFEAVRNSGSVNRVTFVTSSDVYGIVSPELMPITEDTPPAPLNPYAASKAACHHIARQYSMNFDLEVVEVRPFNMVGPRQAPGFVLPDWSKQVADINKNRSRPIISVGRLTDQRDFVDVRDAACAFADIVETGNSGELYHISSGTGTLIKDLLDKLLSFSEVDIEVKQNPDLLRPTKMPVVIGSNRKIKELSGWAPKIPLNQTIEDTLEFWLARI